MTVTQTTAAKTLREMRRQVAADSILFNEHLRADADLSQAAGFSDLFIEACGRDITGSDFYRFGLEYIFEGYLLHYGQSRLLQPDNTNFCLLAGDEMFARGLTAIAVLEDLACVEALAELVRLSSFVHCERLEPSLAMSAWAITTLRLAARATGGDRNNIAVAGSDQATMATTGFGKIIWGNGGESLGAGDAGVDESSSLDRVFAELLSAYPEGKSAELQEIFNNIDANFRAEA
jgi:hypothetical protein